MVNYFFEETLTMELDSLLSKVVRLRRVAADGAVAPHGVTGLQAMLLYELGLRKACSPTDLAHIVGTPAATLGGMLQGMERRGLLERTPTEDKRSHLLHLSEEGKKVERKSTEALEALFAQMYRGFDEADIKQLERYLERMWENLEDRKYGIY